MKPIIAKWIVAWVLLLPFCSAAMAQDNPLANVRIEHGWMHGTAKAIYHPGSDAAYQDDIEIDCAIPQSDVPMDILTVGKAFVSKKQMQQALHAAEQRTDGRFINARGEAYYEGDWHQEAGADISKEDAAKQAIQIGLSYFSALGVEVYPVPQNVSRPYDYDAYLEDQTDYYTHRYSDASFFLARAKSQWKRREAYLPQQTEYTTVTFDVMLGGIRLAPYPAYPAGYADEPDAWETFDTSASVTVSDSGILVEARCILLEIKGRRPFTGDARSFLSEPFLPYVFAGNGEEALTCALQNATRYQLGGSESDTLFQNKDMTEPVVKYGSMPIITNISPVLYTISRNEWIPLWAIETKRAYADGWRE